VGSLAAASGCSPELVAALVRALEDPAAAEQVPIELASGAPSVAGCVRRVGDLRRAVLQVLAVAVPAAAAAAAAAAVDQVLDQALEAATDLLAGALEQAAFLDPLTGLPNRRALSLDLDRALANAGRAGATVGVVMIDLDGLKARNDTEGHAAGDAALRQLGQTLQSKLRRGDSAYRIGGDEFVLLLPSGADGATTRIIERVRAAGAPTFSWGAAHYPADGATPAALLQVADARLYEGRGSRRGLAPVAAPKPLGPGVSRSSVGWRRAVGIALRIATIAVPGAAVALLASSGRSPLAPPFSPAARPPAVHGPPASVPAPARPRTGGSHVAAGGTSLALATATGPSPAGHPVLTRSAPPLSPETGPSPTLPPTPTTSTTTPGPSTTELPPPPPPPPGPPPPPRGHRHGRGPDPDDHHGHRGRHVSALTPWALSLNFGHFLA
jgi:diguanylate cyclase (GGDEF)-like protein